MDPNKLWCAVGTETEVVVIADSEATARHKAKLLLFELSGDEDIVEMLPFERHGDWSPESTRYIDFAIDIAATERSECLAVIGEAWKRAADSAIENALDAVFTAIAARSKGEEFR